MVWECGFAFLLFVDVESLCSQVFLKIIVDEM